MFLVLWRGLHLCVAVLAPLVSGRYGMAVHALAYHAPPLLSFLVHLSGRSRVTALRAESWALICHHHWGRISVLSHPWLPHARIGPSLTALLVASHTRLSRQRIHERRPSCPPAVCLACLAFPPLPPEVWLLGALLMVLHRRRSLPGVPSAFGWLKCYRLAMLQPLHYVLLSICSSAIGL